MSKPTHTAYVVISPREGSERKASWKEVGAMWPHKNGAGFDLVIPEGISLSGRIVLIERKYEPQQIAGPITEEEIQEMLTDKATKA
jgi:hypothetical protein